MQQPIGSKENVTYNIQNSANGTHNEHSNLVERKPLEGSPFYLIKQNDQYFVTLGKYRITEPTSTEQEQLNKFETEHWNIITTVVAIVVEQLQKTDKKTEPYETESL